MRLLYTVVCGILLNGWINPWNTKTVDNGNNEIDIRQYCYPKKAFESPKVYVMVYDSTGEVEYNKFDLTDHGDSYVISNIEYNSHFEKKYVETDSLDSKYFTVNMLDMKGQLNITPGHIPWRIPLTNTLSYINHGAMKVQGTEIVLDIYHYLSKTLPPVKQHYYHGQDCIKDSIEMIAKIPQGNTFTSVAAGNMILYYAKDIGMVCLVSNTNNKIETEYLDKIISVEEFDKLSTLKK